MSPLTPAGLGLHRPIDITTPAEYDAVLNILPDLVRRIATPEIYRIEEIGLDRHELLQIKYGDVRVCYPTTITEEALKVCLANVGKFRGDGRRGLPGTLHRVGATFDEAQNPVGVTIRVARAIWGVAEPLREFIEAARSLLVVGPPAVGKTTLLRDVARIRLETRLRGLFVIDSSNEITGDGPTTHAMLRGIGRLKVGDPEYQAAQLRHAIRTHGAGDLLTDELGYNQDVALFITAARLGIGRIATVHGEVLDDVVHNPLLQALLGITFDERAGQAVKRAKSIFDTAVTVHGKGRYEVHTGLDALAPRMLAGEVIPGLKVGDWPDELAEAAD